MSSLSQKRQIWGQPFFRFWLKLRVRKTQCNQIRKVKVFLTWKLNVRTNSPFLVSLWRTRNTPCPDVEWWSTWKGVFFYWQSIQQCIKACKLQIPKKNLKIILQNIPWRLLRSLTECHGTKDSRWVLGRIRLLLDQYIQHICVLRKCLNRSLKPKLSLTSIFNIWIQDVF